MRRLALAVMLLLMTAAHHANSATIYFAGGEDTSFTVVGSPSGVDVSDTVARRTAFAREALSMANGTTVADPPANRMATPTFTSASTLWIHAQVYSAGVITTTSGEQAMLVRSPDGVSRIVLRQTGTNGTLKVSKRNAAGTITDLATASGTFSVNTVTSFDLQIVYGCTSGDQVNLWLAGVSVISFTGASICTDAATSLNQAEFASINNGAYVTQSGLGCDNAGGAASTCWSEVIAADSDTRGMGLWTLAPQASGNTQSWTPNTVGDVNPTAINDTNFVSTGSNNALSEWTTPTSPPSGTWNVIAIVQEARVLASTSGPSTAEWLMRTKDGTDYVTGSFTPPVAAFGNFSNQIWTTNPHTSAAFVIGDIAAGFNLGIESTP